MKKAFVITTFIGTLAINDGNKVVGFRLIGEKEIPEKLLRAKEELIEEEKELMEELKKEGFEVIKGNEEKENWVKENLFEIAKELKVVKDRIEFNSLISRIGAEIARLNIKKAIRKVDPYGVDLASGVEKSRCHRDPEKPRSGRRPRRGHRRGRQVDDL